MSKSSSSLRIVLEQGKTKVFASALDWPGWSRAGKKTPEAAIEQFLAYRERYEAVLACGEGLNLPAGDLEISIVEEQPGDGATDFGVPGKVSVSEHESISNDELERQIAVLQACWTFFDQVEARVSPNLRKGPRGGGRDRAKLVEHVLESEGGYSRYLGLNRPADAIGERVSRGEDVVAALREHGPAGNAPGKSWPVRYIIRRMAWHVLDHAWEMEDKDLSEESES